ncbi:MAG: hypothetical protein E7392_04415 [Ruminococcaceae bacterium]|nr:hypothetical protein [Oscillospiraceae bacterium]
MINKDKVKGFIAGLSAALVLCTTTVFADNISKTVTAIYNDIKIMIDGEEIIPKDVNGNTVEPFIIDGTTYLPVRAVASALGKDVNWDGETNTVFIGEMPVKKTSFSVNGDIMKSFSDTTLFTINSAPVSGGIMNFYITNNTPDEYMRYACDNYSPNGTLQTLTIDSVPAAKFQAEQALENIKLIYSLCSEAQKKGFATKASTKASINKDWEEYRAQFADNAALLKFAEQSSLSLSELENLAKKTFLATLYMENLYENKLKENYDTKDFEEIFRKNYITAKHILVKDEALAKEIIEKLNNGENFDELMKKHNTDPGATVEGYTFTYGEMVEPFEKAAFALNEDTFTKEAVKTNYGYHIIYRCKFNEAALETALSAQKEMLASEATNTYITTLSQKAVVKFNDNYTKYITTIE